MTDAAVQRNYWVKMERTFSLSIEVWTFRNSAIFYRVRPSSFFSSFTVVRPTQICSIFKKKKSSDVVTSYFTLNNSFNLKNEHSNSIEKNRNKNMNIFHSILYILLIQICQCYLLTSSWGTGPAIPKLLVIFFSLIRPTRYQETNSTVHEKKKKKNGMA